MPLLYRFLLYGFPLFLLLAEALFKFSKGEPQPATSYYVALCSGAASLLLTATIPKNIDHKFSTISLPTGCTLRSVLDERLSAAAWAILFLTITTWMYFLATPELNASYHLIEFNNGKILYTPDPFSPEFLATGFIYFSGVVTTEIKEKI